MIAERDDFEICQELDKNRLKVVHAIMFMISTQWEGRNPQMSNSVGMAKQTTVYQPGGISCSREE